ncbi:hypothetical protein TeGR_g11626 [Tetraparma gracilis]|uniref:rRNA adenine N(6)-methyltransferase n=1 Tax=Tetraparma gracilis TaxID=2962635 RepID=A0ABQ6M6U1_9STRA|nr:hypothetical protein TeGR_g11626 [Tetraparma gracilis]
MRSPPLVLLVACLSLLPSNPFLLHPPKHHPAPLRGWVKGEVGGWTWDDAVDTPPPPDIPRSSSSLQPPKLPPGSFRPKQSLGQNFLTDQNTINNIVSAFAKDASLPSASSSSPPPKMVELGPGPGALTNVLVARYGAPALTCVEIDPRAVSILRASFPGLSVRHADVLRVEYPLLNAALAGEQPLAVIGNLPYYITSQILFALADASHADAVRCATVTMQREVGDRLVAGTSTKDYGILSVVFQLYADVRMHFRIPNTVFYPKPKVESALMGLKFVGAKELRRRLRGARPKDLQRVVKACFGQRRKVIRNTLKGMMRGEFGEGEVTEKIGALGELGAKRPEELGWREFVEVTRGIYGVEEGWEDGYELGDKVWRKEKHGGGFGEEEEAAEAVAQD